MTFEEKMEHISPAIYPHEREALIRWNSKLKVGVRLSEAMIYRDACEVLFKTIRERIERDELVK